MAAGSASKHRWAVLLLLRAGAAALAAVATVFIARGQAGVGLGLGGASAALTVLLGWLHQRAAETASTQAPDRVGRVEPRQVLVGLVLIGVTAVILQPHSAGRQTVQAMLALAVGFSFFGVLRLLFPPLGR